MPHSHARRLGRLATARRIGHNWRGLAAVLALAAAYLLVMALYPNLPLRQGYIGIALGAVAALVVVTMTADPAMDGRLAEQWSFERLRKVRGWDVTDNLSFDEQDVDHVVVTPAAVLAVETRFHATAYPQAAAEAARHRRDLAAAERAAGQVRTLLRTEKASDRAVVVPVLIIWGPGAPALPEGHRLDAGVRVVDGAQPQLWMHLFNAPRLDAATRLDLYARFQRRAASRAAHDATALAPLHQQLWRELRAGIAHERTTRPSRHERHERHRAMRRRHRLPLVVATTALAPSAPSAGTAQAGG